MNEASLVPADPVVITTSEADSDASLIKIWLHGRSQHTQRAYAADAASLRSWTGKSFVAMTLADLQADTSRNVSVRFVPQRRGDVARSIQVTP